MRCSRQEDCQKYNCSLRRLDYAEQGLSRAVFRWGLNLIRLRERWQLHPLLFCTICAIYHFTQELFMAGESLLRFERPSTTWSCGQEETENPNGLILGTPGSENLFCQRKLLMLVTQDDIISEIRKENTIPLSTHLRAGYPYSLYQSRLLSINGHQPGLFWW